MSSKTERGRFSFGRGPQWLRPFKIPGAIRHMLLAALLSASVAQIVEHFGTLKLVTKLSVLVVSNFATSHTLEPVNAVDVASGAPMVVLLGSTDFVMRYGERSPLDRCEMALDIGRLLAKSPKRMAVDFDLSPLHNPSAGESQCQARLDAVLAAHADQLVVLAPFPVSAPTLMRAKHDWMLAQCQRGLHFADGRPAVRATKERR